MSSDDEKISGLKNNNEEDESEEDVQLKKRQQKKPRKAEVQRAKQDSSKKPRAKRNTSEPEFESSQDSDDDGNLEDSESDVEPRAKRELRPKKNPKRSEQPSAEDESDEESEEEEGKGRGRRDQKGRKTKGKPKREYQDWRKFVEDAAEEDDEEEEHHGRTEEDRRRMKEIYRRKNKHTILDDIENKSVEEIARQYEEKEDEYEEDFGQEEVEDDQRASLPTPSDPRLYFVRCKAGFEREAAVSLLNKYFVLASSGNPLRIFSVSAPGKLVGSIIVEATQINDVKQAVTGLLALNPELVKLVPTRETLALYQPDPRQEVVSTPGTFVRIRRGPYVNDLAIIERLDDDSNALILRLVPRLGTATTKAEGSSEPSQRPSQRLFDPALVPDPQHISKLSGSKGAFAYKNQRFEGGFLIRKFAANNVEVGGAPPSFEEAQLFKFSEQSNPHKQNQLVQALAQAADAGKRIARLLAKGDDVKVVTGEHAGSIGRVLNVGDKSIRIELLSNSATRGTFETTAIDVDPAFLQKHFAPGQTVQVIEGKHKGQQGTVVRTTGSNTHLVSEDRKGEIVVLTSDLRVNIGGAIPTTSNNHANFDPSNTEQVAKHELVQLTDNKTVGLVLSVMPDSITLMDTDNFVTNQPKLRIAARLTRPQHTTNCFGQDVHSKCTVRVVGGAQKDVRAPVLRIHRDKVFLVDRAKIINGGVFVEDANNCFVLESQIYDDSRKAARFTNVISPNNPQPGAEENRGGPAAAGQNVKVSLIGQKKRIVKGPWKDYEGIIQSVSDNSVRFELSARSKVVTIPLDCLNINLEDREALQPSGVYSSRTPQNRPLNSPYFTKGISTPVYNPNFDRA